MILENFDTMPNNAPNKPRHYGELICLNAIQQEFEEKISNYAITETEILHDDDEDTILKAIHFERGISTYIIVLQADGGIKTIDEEMPISLLADIHNCIIDVNLIMNEFKLIRSSD